jgi:hypothetical protein
VGATFELLTELGFDCVEPAEELEAPRDLEQQAFARLDAHRRSEPLRPASQRFEARTLALRLSLEYL